jgi:hypothetical protein
MPFKAGDPRIFSFQLELGSYAGDIDICYFPPNTPPP